MGEPHTPIYIINPAGNYMFKVNNRNTRTRCEICSKLTIKTPERRNYMLKIYTFIMNFNNVTSFCYKVGQ